MAASSPVRLGLHVQDVPVEIKGRFKALTDRFAWPIRAPVQRAEVQGGLESLMQMELLATGSRLTLVQGETRAHRLRC